MVGRVVPVLGTPVRYFKMPSECTGGGWCTDNREVLAIEPTLTAHQLERFAWISAASACYFSKCRISCFWFSFDLLLIYRQCIWGCFHWAIASRWQQHAMLGSYHLQAGPRWIQLTQVAADLSIANPWGCTPPVTFKLSVCKRQWLNLSR